MNLFKSVIKWIGVGSFACFAYAATLQEPIIERIFLKKEHAQKYCDTYKESHNYTFEEVTITE
jgi:hypothetical protein